ncbi:phage tail protein [Fulvivirga sp. RKSG066]|uniref:phage tail protein n=1 Tax=Fulvivirga aurantia TaxID=2529383 RepID=UPI0012BC63A1|nr:phage tail protein [Fulvivirga aurantia]MTI22455.1 phage tail protein [Fulvivirga aurantia]
MAKHYPVPGFRFAVNLSGASASGTDKSYDASFQEISGISVEIPTEDIQEGGENRFIHRVPQPIKYPNLILKRGMVVVKSEFANWVKSTVETGFAKPLVLRNIIVTLLSEKDEPIMSWTFEKAYPVKKEVSGFGADKNQLLVETIELAFQRFEENR